MTEQTKDATQKGQGQAFAPFTADFEGFDGGQHRITLRFKKPGRKELIQLAKADKAKQFDVACNILTRIAHPDDQETVKEIIQDEPVLAMSFVDVVMRRCGAGVVEPGN